MTLLFLYGWTSISGGAKLTNLTQSSTIHEVRFFKWRLWRISHRRTPFVSRSGWSKASRSMGSP